ncbi:MAG TPA: sugar ABC transporter substrate-binding protein [Propionicimonas sp.]|nr:sugar ABC transporter substrate-binding protein [Propionicimonas sp.]
MRKILAATLATISAVALTACSTGATPGATGSAAGGESSAAGGAGEKIKIGIALPAGNQTFWTGWIKGAQAEAAKLNVDLTITDAKNDAQTMNDQVNTMIVSGIKGLAVASVDPTANKPAAQAATDAGIKMITSNRTLDMAYGGVGGANPIVHTGFNDVQMGGFQGDLLIKACEGKDPCNVALQVGTLGATPQVARSKGLKDKIASVPTIKIVMEETNDFDPVKAADVTATMLQKDKNIDFMLAQTDPEALAAATVIKEQGLEGKIGVIGIGGSLEGTQAVASGKMFGTVKVSGNDDGATSVRTIAALVRGEEIKVDTTGERPTVVVDALIITKDNAADNPGDW